MPLLHPFPTTSNYRILTPSTPVPPTNCAEEPVMRASEKRKEVEKFWNKKPCGSRMGKSEWGSMEFFKEIEEDRYKYEGHILDVIDKLNWEGKKVLEIGTGVGTDARKLIGKGAQYTGINIDQGSVDITAKALDVFSMQGKVKKCDATKLSFDDNYFDVVYTFGALPCIPNLEEVMDEIYRVTKPGGEVLALFYNKSSINYHIEIMFLRKIFRRLLVIPGAIVFFSLLGINKDTLIEHRKLYREKRGMSDEEWLSRNTDGPENPYICVQDENDANKLFNKFKIECNEVYFFDFRHWGIIGKLLPISVIKYLGRKWGWHRIVYAKK